MLLDIPPPPPCLLLLLLMLMLMPVLMLLSLLLPDVFQASVAALCVHCVFPATSSPNDCPTATLCRPASPCYRPC